LSNLLSGRKSKSATEAVQMLYETAEDTSQPQVLVKRPSQSSARLR
jgi:hypothetical protein